VLSHKGLAKLDFLPLNRPASVTALAACPGSGTAACEIPRREGFTHLGSRIVPQTLILVIAAVIPMNRKVQAHIKTPKEKETNCSAARSWIRTTFNFILLNKTSTTEVGVTY
jgi:hypothetical protein